MLLFALRFKRLKQENPHMFDGKLAAAAVAACLAQDGYPEP